ncbi:DUF4910 domain-containing protein [Candidatus Micrarchaeota archaeon]|nr:DUF4910 domain-containing protein [Candidatus Micrarchaeota archaeon]
MFDFSDDFVKESGKGMYSLMEQLYPICRSITGNGVRETLKILSKTVPLETKEIPTGTAVFDWTIPKEWNISDAYIKDPKGKKIVDFKNSNLHVLGYSIPVHKKFKLSELKKHLFTLPDYPDSIPYLTSYYREKWGFCLTHNQFDRLEDGEYEVHIDSSLTDGSLTFGEYVIKGKTDDEVLISCYVCHPSMCNDSISGVVLATWLAKLLTKHKNKLHYTYRFLFIPETIGAITWLSLNEKNVHRIKHGLILTCVGDSGGFTYKKSRAGNNMIDLAAQKVLTDSGDKHRILEFDPFVGSDERQYCSPGFNLPVGSMMRTTYPDFSEYHTSKDDLDFVTAKGLGGSFEQYLMIINILENDRTYINLNPKCEPQLGKRGLYDVMGSQKNHEEFHKALFWALNFSDGSHSLLDISIRSSLKFDVVKSAADALCKAGLMRIK